MDKVIDKITKGLGEAIPKMLFVMLLLLFVLPSPCPKKWSPDMWFIAMVFGSAMVAVGIDLLPKGTPSNFLFSVGVLLLAMLSAALAAIGGITQVDAILILAALVALSYFPHGGGRSG